MSRLLDDWIKTYVSEYSSSSEAPDHMHLWTSVSVIAGALRRCVWFPMGHFKWYPNFYIVFVAKPGIVAKSTTISIGMDLLRELNCINFGPDAVTWQALVQALGKATEGVEIDSMTHTMSCLTIAASEFGTFLDPHNREMIDVMVEMYDSKDGEFKKMTKTQGSDNIMNPWLNVIACTTPAWIAGNFPEYLIGGGFASRTIFVYADRKRHLSAYPQASMSPEHEDLKKKLVHDLEIISEMRGAFKLSPEALEWGNNWYIEHNKILENGMDSDRIQGYLARKQAHMHKLAMVLSASASSEMILHQHHLQAAAELLKTIELSMPEVFRLIGASEGARMIGEIIQFVRAHQGLTRQDLYQQFMSRVSSKEFDETLQSCIVAGQVTVKNAQFYAPQPMEADIVNLEVSETSQ